MANLICNNPVYTVLRNGKVITMSGTSTTAIANIAADAINVVCPPECCITEVPITIDSFDIVVTTAEYTGLSIRATITHGVDTYSTSWVAAAATNTIDLTGLIVEFATFTDGDTICIEYSYSDRDAIQGCCLTVQVNTYLEDDTYQLSEIVTECDGGTFDLVFQNPDGGVTVDADGEMVVPDIEADETVYVTYACDGCVTELLILTATNVVPPEGLRILFTDIDALAVTLGITDTADVAQWNFFLFNLPANGTEFTSVAVTGNEAIFVGGGGMTIGNGLFLNPANVVLELEDQSGVVLIVGNAALISNPITIATINTATTLNDGAFSGCADLVTISAVLATIVKAQCFLGCTSATLIDIPLCVTLGNNAADATVFDSIVGQTITLNIAAVNATNNAGGVHASVAYLIANNTATVNYI